MKRNIFAATWLLLLPLSSLHAQWETIVPSLRLSCGSKDQPSSIRVPINGEAKAVRITNRETKEADLEVSLEFDTGNEVSTLIVKSESFALGENSSKEIWIPNDCRERTLKAVLIANKTGAIVNKVTEWTFGNRKGRFCAPELGVRPSIMIEVER